MWANGFIEANGLNVFYHRSGSGSNKPPVMLLHGFTDNGLCWSRVAKDLEETFDVIMPDARGHGHTRGPIGDLRIELLAEDAAAIIQNLGLEKPYLFGHSMGAVTALALAANKPQLVKAAVLEDPPLINPETFELTPEEARQHQKDIEAQLAFQTLPILERMAYGQAANPQWSADEIGPWAESKGEYNPEILDHRARIGSFPWQKAIAKVECPLLLITADTGSGALVTTEVSQEVTRLSQRCETAYIKGAGHCIHRDRYPETMAVVLSFLGRH